MFNFLSVSPVEQFLILPLLPLFKLISINNVFVILVIIGIFFYTSLFIFFKTTTFFKSSLVSSLNDYAGFYIIPKHFQAILEFIYVGVMNIVKDNVAAEDAEKFFPIVFSLFLFLVSSNLIGIIPYSYTITSHLIVTFSLSLSFFIGINIICILKHKTKIFNLFLPNGTSAVLAFLLVPIEFISYIFKPISLSIRLFANMMAGHTLLKVIAGFSVSLVVLSQFVFLVIHIIPSLILIPLFVLESAVAVIQAFVFTVLICIYINDAINLH